MTAHHPQKESEIAPRFKPFPIYVKVCSPILIFICMVELWFECFEYYPYICGSLDAIPSVTMGSCKSKMVIEFYYDFNSA